MNSSSGKGRDQEDLGNRHPYPELHGNDNMGILAQHPIQIPKRSPNLFLFSVLFIAISKD
jgi:hypothetical protein